jgi:hypothetical protein
MSSPQQPHSPYPPHGGSPYQNQNQAYQQSPQQQYYPPQQPYYLPPAIDPVSSDDQPERNTLIRVFCILFAVYHILFTLSMGLGAFVKQPIDPRIPSQPMFGILAVFSLFATITLFILGIHKNFAKEGGQFKAIGLLFGNFTALFNIQVQFSTSSGLAGFNIVKSLFFLMVYLGVSFQKQVKFFRYFAPLKWNYGSAQ